MELIFIYLIIINALSLILMLVDKLNALKNAARIPEITLVTIAIIGGSIGEMISMYLFRHKTKHIKFALGLPLLLTLHIILIFIFKEFLL